MFTHEQHRRSTNGDRETSTPANAHVSLQAALVRYGVAALFVVGAALYLPVLGSNLFNLLILGLNDVFYTSGPLLSAVEDSHRIVILAVVLMNALFLIGLTQQVLTKHFRVAWDTGAMALVYADAVWLVGLTRT